MAKKEETKQAQEVKKMYTLLFPADEVSKIHQILMKVSMPAEVTRPLLMSIEQQVMDQDKEK